MVESIDMSYTRAKFMIAECKSISHLFVTRRYLKLFESRAASSRPELVRDLNDKFQTKKRSIVTRYETRHTKTKKGNEG